MPLAIKYIKYCPNEIQFIGFEYLVGFGGGLSARRYGGHYCYGHSPGSFPAPGQHPKRLSEEDAFLILKCQAFVAGIPEPKVLRESDYRGLHNRLPLPNCSDYKRLSSTDAIRNRVSGMMQR